MMPTEAAKAVLDHYQKTFELTYTLWLQRNRIFLILLGVIGAATLLTYRFPQAEPLLVDLVATTLGVTDANRLKDLHSGFPFGLVQSILLLVVFYLTVNLYHRATYVLRLYRYLAKLETEIRQQLDLGENAAAFTRESTFYWKEKAPFSGWVKWVYAGLLGCLLIAFMGGRVWSDFQSGNAILGLADLVITIPTVTFFFAYAYATIWFEPKEATAGESE